MASHTIYSVENEIEPIELDLVCLGSSSEEAIGIWQDTSRVMWQSLFTDDIVPSSSQPFPFSAPSWDNPVAMSSNPVIPECSLRDSRRR